MQVDTNITESRDPYIYVQFQNSCDKSSLVGIRGVVALEDYNVRTRVFSQDEMCSSKLACVYDPDSDLCASLNPTSSVSRSTGVDSYGNVIDCDTNICSVYNSDVCFSSSAYEPCQVSWVFQNELGNSLRFYNSNEEDQFTLLNY
jgi:hypothetical protein